MKNVLIIILVIALISCENRAQSIEYSSNSDIKLELLFEHDGCKVYRFRDGGYPVYWTNCQGNIQSYYKSGKSTITNHSITSRQ